MIAQQRVEHYWDTREYAEMVDVQYREGRLVVAFADGATVTVEVTLLCDYGVAESGWSGATIEDEAIVVPAITGTAEIPWDVIRVLTDRAFDDYLRQQAAKSAQVIGSRFRRLREHRNVSLADVAGRSGVSLVLLDKFENGRLRSSFDFEDRVLAAIGCNQDDLYSAEQTPSYGAVH